MASEGRYIAGKIERNVRLLIDELRGIPDEDLNRRLDLRPSNTLYQLGFHALGSARYWAVTLAGGEDFHRDRPSEFAASGSGEALIADLERSILEIHALLDPIQSADMEWVTAGAVRHRSVDADAEGLPLRDSLLHALEHTALHLGHAQITRQLLGYPPARAD